MSPLFPLITSLASRNREYVLLLGAGVSKDAGVPTGWDILIETMKPIYVMENGVDNLPSDWYKVIEAWYESHSEYSTLGYSQILERIYQGDIERREYLKQFFSNKQPGVVHKSIATLVKSGLLRFIFTTNFDDLLEKALDEVGIDYDVVSSDATLNASISWDKVRHCRIYKLHGDYRAGKIRNTLSELQSLDIGMADDFQYIIDRHGLIVIGYAGRDPGVMRHLGYRKPFPYPLYWQYVEMPPRAQEYNPFYGLKDKYEHEYQREIVFIQNPSASAFLNDLMMGIDKLERAVIIENDAQAEYRNAVETLDPRKLRGMSLDLANSYHTLFKELSAKSDKDVHYDFKYDLFTEFTSSINGPFLFVDELLRHDLVSEATYLCEQLFKPFTAINENIAGEFFRLGVLYHLFTNLGICFLRHNQIDIFRTSFYQLQFERYGREGQMFLDLISLSRGGWEHIAKSRYEYRYWAHEFLVIRDHHLPPCNTPEDFTRFDAYITMDMLARNLPYYWAAGSSMSTEEFLKVYFDYFDKVINDRARAIAFLNTAAEIYNRKQAYMDSGIGEVEDVILRKFKLTWNDIH